MTVRALALAVLLAGSAAAGAQPVLREIACPLSRTSGGAPSAAALNCLTLVPVPDLPRAAGTIALLPAPSPFGVAVRADGRPRYRLVGAISGLPDPRTLGGGGYVAWAYTLALDSAVKLGPVTNGRVDLGMVERSQFRVLVTAERSPAAVKERTGRLVLRGTSPGARLMTHRDLTAPTSPGAPPTEPVAGHGMPHTMAHGDPARAWPMPPMPASQPMMAGMDGLVPSVTPFLPPNDSTVPLARPRQLVRLKDGDTLALDAGLVRRVVGNRAVAMYGFNGQSPGPLVEVAQGATVVVRFRNALGQPSAVHWHGVRLDNRYDGAVGVTQDAVAPGDSFTYVVHFPDAGIYWYHPHVREDVQQDLGLAGNLLVRSRDTNYYGPANREEVLMLDDLLVGDGGLAPYGAESPTHALMGRFGNLLLVNGEPRYALSVRRGEVVRFHLTNASSARIFNLSLAGAAAAGARVKVVASDVGKFEREAWVSSVVIAPAERYVIDVEFARAGDVALVNRVQALTHTTGVYTPEIDTLGVVRVAPERATPSYGARFKTLRRNADVAASLTAYRRHFTRPPDRTLVLGLRTRALPPTVSSMLQGINAPVEWNDGMTMMNWLTTGREVAWVLRDPATGKEDLDIAWRFRQGDVVKLRLFNDPAASHAMAHPIHLHGQRFLVLSRDGVRNANLVWKDTAIIPAGETVDVLVDMANPGRWMLHCHVAEHLSAGMMTTFTVDPR